jgi:osmotically inducible protein OsmC
MAARRGKAEWHGNLIEGSGRLTIGEDLWTGDYSFSSRFHDVLEGAGATTRITNPEEVLATAHAACFSMALSLVLSEHGHTPTSISTTASVHLRLVGGIPTIQRIDLETDADVAGIEPADFQQRAEEARAGCILSRALAGVEDITLSARLGGATATDSPDTP